MSDLADVAKNSDKVLNNFHKYFNIEKILKYLEGHWIDTLIAVLIIVFYGKIRRFLKEIMVKAFEKFFKENPGVATFFSSIIAFIIDAILVFFVLKLLGIELSGIATFFGAISLVLGFAFKDTLSNFFGGVILLTFRPFQVNDVIEYKNFTGTVERIEIFYTTIVNFQNEEVIIPNANLISNEIRNINSNAHRRLDIQIGVGYGSNIEQVKSKLLEIIERRREDLFYIDTDAPLIGMYNIGASALEFDVRVYVREYQWLNARYYLNETIKTEFDELGIELPYNIIDLQVNSEFNKLDIKNIT